MNIADEPAETKLIRASTQRLTLLLMVTCLEASCASSSHHTTTNTGGTSGAGTGGASSGSGGGPSGGGGSATGQLIFVGDFETGDLTQWNYIERCKPDRILVYSTANAPAGAPAPREGHYAVRFRVLDTDIEPCTGTDNPRAELETPESLFKPGDDRWEAWSMYIPNDHAQPACGACPDGTWFAFQEDYGAPWPGPPAIAWLLDFTETPNRFRIDRGEPYGDSPGGAPLVAGRWVDFLVHKTFANTADGGGLIEAWVDKVPITFRPCNCTKLMTQTVLSSQPSLGFYLTSYREHGSFATFDIFYDAVRIGTTREIVELK